MRVPTFALLVLVVILAGCSAIPDGRESKASASESPSSLPAESATTAADEANCDVYVEAVRQPDPIAPSIDEIREAMRNLWACEGKPEPELFARSARYNTFNEALRGKEAREWNGWVLKAVIINSDPPSTQPFYTSVDVSMRPNRGEPGAPEQVDVILNQVSIDQIKNLGAYQLPNYEQLPIQQIAFSGRVSTVQYNGQVTLDSVHITPKH